MASASLGSTLKSIKQFKRHIDYELGQHNHLGVNGLGEDTQFVCQDALKDYWSWEKVINVLRETSNTEANAGAILRHHLILFSLLCYIERPHRLDDFIADNTANALPLSETSIQATWWTNDDGFRQLFLRTQWKFIPLIFDKTLYHRTDLAMERILPIDNRDREVLGEPKDQTAVFRVSLFPCCIGQDFKDILDVHQSHTPRTYYVVLKMFVIDSDDEEDRRLWENEVAAYNTLDNYSGGWSTTSFGTDIPLTITRRSTFNYITRYMGLLKRKNSGEPKGDLDLEKLNGTHFIIIEYAPGGDLSDFCRNHIGLITSTTRENRRNLWHHLFELLQGLHAIHNAGNGGTHQDIQEGNIVYTNGDLSDWRKPCFKITDLGRSHFDQVSTSEKVNGYNWGNRKYMAPECCCVNNIEQTVPPKYTRSADIWGLGCLFSEMLVRSALGPTGLDDYKQARKKENENTDIGDISSWCFHDGSWKRLSCVDEYHQKAINANPDDEVTRLVSSLVLDFMLQPKETRAKDDSFIRNQWGRYARSGHQPDKAVFGPPENSTSPMPSGPVVTVAAEERSLATAEPAQTSAPTATGMAAHQSSAMATTSVQMVMAHLQKRWRARIDQHNFPQLFLVVDDSDTMVLHRHQVSDTVRVLGKLLKHRVQKPSENIKFYLLSEPTHSCGLDKSSKLAKRVKKHEFVGTEEFKLLISRWFQELAQGVLAALPSQSISLYILTDGKYDSPLNLIPLIKNMMTSLRKAGYVMPDFVAMTIIQFGDNPEGYRELLKIQQKMERVMKSDFKESYPIYICKAGDDVADLLTGGIRANTVNQQTASAAPQGARNREFLSA
ncbi:hypothetical protein QBC44DRAFT_140233 [Cladorrhinum sp. PSN332]|nr:hypothetical protein QBC44DRAFT_140233 [Cladorrhinum sp. PSN332]